MNNIAFTTLVILVMAFPGHVLRASYYAGTFTRNVLPKSWTDDIAKAALYSLPLHLFWILLFEGLKSGHIISTSITFEVAYRVFIGQQADDLSDARLLYDNKLILCAYYSCVFLGALVLGHLFRWLVWRNKLDVRYPWLLRYRNEWLYTLLGRDVPVPTSYPNGKVYVRIEGLTRIPTEEPDKTRLYRGFVEAFTTEETGALRDILVKEAERGIFEVDPANPLQKKFSWKAISPGDLIILKYSELQNLNITYLISVPEEDPKAPADPQRDERALTPPSPSA
jgi:hypothetical protein